MIHDPNKTIILMISTRSESHRSALEATLLSSDFVLFHSFSIQATVELLMQQEFAVVLIDMPPLSGIETAKAIRQYESKVSAGRTPILLIIENVNFIDEANIRASYAIGAVDFLLGPYDTDTLCFKLSIFVDLYKSKKLDQEAKRAHNLLLVERENFLSLFKQAPELVCILSGPSHVFEFVNDAHIKVLGFDATGKTFREAQPESVEIHGILDRVYETGVAAELREIPVTVGERLRYFDLTYAARRDELGEVNGIMILGAEITGRVLVQHSLQDSAAQLEKAVKERTTELTESRAFLDSLFENIPNMVFVKDAKDLKFVRFNKAGEDLLGYPRAHLIGKNDFDFFPEKQAESFISKDLAVLSGHEIVDIPEEVIQTKFQGERILHTKKIPLFGSDGKPEFLLGISEDITNVKKAEIKRLQLIREQAAAEERERSTKRTMFLAEASMILTSSLDYRETLERLAKLVIPVLGDWCTITMLREDEYSFERVAAIHADPTRAKLIEDLNAYYPTNLDTSLGIGQVIRSGASSLCASVSDEDLCKAAQDERHLEIMRNLGCSSCMIVPIRSRNRIQGAIAFMSNKQDYTYNLEDLATAEELGRRAGIAIENALLFESVHRAVQSRDDFLSIASHELKTPITSLKLQIQMTRRNVKPELGVIPTAEKLAKVLDTSNVQINRLTALVDDLLDVSRIQSGKLTYNFEQTDLSELVREGVERLSEQLQAAHCQLTMYTDEPVFVHCDRFRMEQVIVNLLSNAAKYAAGKPVVVKVCRLGERARITVSDQGMGIPANKLETIFERFERAVPSNNISGLGLGLFIISEIVKAHHGIVRAESKLGEGSTFFVELAAEAKQA